MSARAIQPSELLQLKDHGPLQLIDVRTPAEFHAAHVEFARNIPLNQLDAADFADSNAQVRSPLVFICQGGTRGQKACEALERAGIANVANVAGGTQACITAGLPVVYGKQTISLERQVRIAAGSLVLAGLALSLIHPWFLALSAFVGTGLAFSGLTDTCGMAIILARMPWNRAEASEIA
jgi:rhodanese-related sulfurtransferase